MQNPIVVHWEAALRVVRHLKGNLGQGIMLSSNNDLYVSAYCDSDWVRCPLTQRSLTGYFVMLGHSSVSWNTKKQHTISRSSAEAEYRSMATTIYELKWLKGLLYSFGVVHSRPMKLFANELNTLKLIVISFAMKFSAETLRQSMCERHNNLQTYSPKLFGSNNFTISYISWEFKTYMLQLEEGYRIFCRYLPH
ncbi:hypothetical protein Tco_1170664 [Tanacetum coccineum]